MDENDLRRDFHFLENVLGRKDGAKRTLSQSCGGALDEGGAGGKGAKDKRKRHNAKRHKLSNSFAVTTESIPQNLEIHKPAVQRLVKASWQRKCYLTVMSPGMSRRDKNTSRHVQKSDTIFWRVQLVFVAQRGAAQTPSNLLQSSLETANETDLASVGGLVGISLDGVDENAKLSAVLSPLIDQVVTDGGGGGARNEPQRHALRHLRLHRDQVVCMLQRIPSSNNDPVFTNVDESLTLREALCETKVLEFPVLFVGLGDDVSHLKRTIEEVVESNELEKEEETETGEDGNDEEGEGEGEEDDDNDDEDDGEGFMAELAEMGQKDIQTLKAIIEEEV
jgi:hypothetical protein